MVGRGVGHIQVESDSKQLSLLRIVQDLGQLVTNFLTALDDANPHHAIAVGKRLSSVHDLIQWPERAKAPPGTHELLGLNHRDYPVTGEQ